MDHSNLILFAFLAVYLADTCLTLWLDSLNARRLKQSGNGVPQGFEDFVDAGTLAEMRHYSLENLRFGTVRTVVFDAALLVLLLSGVLPPITRLLSGTFGLGPLPSGLIFFSLLGVGAFLLALPFDYHDVFTIEQKHGFNRSTLRTWIQDQLKSAVLGAILGLLLIFLILWTIERFPVWWWLWGFILVSAVQILLVVIYPVLIAPLFNRFEPLKDRELEQRIRRLMEDRGIRVRSILQMDAGMRSGHTNAYFTGLGRTKRVVLFDTLLESHTSDEILAVLAHELGHYTRRHLLWRILLFQAGLLAGIYLTYVAVSSPALYRAFGFDPTQTYTGLFLMWIFWTKAAFFLTPFHSALSRRFETEADAYAARILDSPDAMIRALKRLAKDNLSNLNPHPLYVLFHYSHPPLVERVRTLEHPSSSSTTTTGVSA